MSDFAMKYSMALEEIDKLDAKINIYEDFLTYLHQNVGDNEDWPIEIGTDGDETSDEFIEKANRCFVLMGLAKEMEDEQDD